MFDHDDYDDYDYDPREDVYAGTAASDDYHLDSEFTDFGLMIGGDSDLMGEY